MGKLSKTFEEYLATNTSSIPVIEFTAALVLTAVIAALLGRLYVVCGQSLSNRKKFSGNFVLLATTTMIIITVVKSSLALSLGLVGALSIVRFRSAIKDPEELAYLFLTIAIGLGMGAGQWLITIVGIGVVGGLMLMKHVCSRADDAKNLILTVSSPGSRDVAVKQVVDVLKQHCSAVDLKRMDVNGKSVEATFQVEFDSFENLEATREQLLHLDASMQLAFLDNRGLA